MEHEENGRFIGRFREYSAKTLLRLMLEGGTFLAGHTPPPTFLECVLAIYCGHLEPAVGCRLKCDAALDQPELGQTSIWTKFQREQDLYFAGFSSAVP